MTISTRCQRFKRVTTPVTAEWNLSTPMVRRIASFSFTKVYRRPRYTRYFNYAHNQICLKVGIVRTTENLNLHSIFSESLQQGCLACECNRVRVPSQIKVTTGNTSRSYNTDTTWLRNLPLCTGCTVFSSRMQSKGKKNQNERRCETPFNIHYY